MSAREFLINLALLGIIVFVGVQIYNMEEQRFDGMSDKTIQKLFERGSSASDQAETSYGGSSVLEDYPHYQDHRLFETLVTVTPTPTPPVWEPPTPPTLKEALRNRWKFSYAMGAPLGEAKQGEAQWTDNTNQEDFKLEPGATKEFQFGKFEFTIKLASIDGNDFAANLETVKIMVEGHEIPPSLLRGPDQKVTYSLLSPGNNP